MTRMAPIAGQNRGATGEDKGRSTVTSPKALGDNIAVEHRGVVRVRLSLSTGGCLCRCVRVYLRRRQFWSPRFVRPPGRKYRPRNSNRLRQRLRLPRQLPRLNRVHLARRQPGRVLPRRMSRWAARRCRLLKSLRSTRNHHLHPTLTRLRKRRLRLPLLLRRRPSRPALPMSREEPRWCRSWRVS